MIRFFTAILFLASVLCAGLLSGPDTGRVTGVAHADDEAPAATFFSGIDDMPLMPGLTELPEATLVFDSPSGRFVEVFAVGQVTAADIDRFYAASLPQLGWTALATSSYQREGEVLEINIVDPATDDGTHTVRFAISPKTGTNGN